MKRPAKTSSGSVPRSVERDYLAALDRAGVSRRDMELLRGLARDRQLSDAATAKRAPKPRHYG
jgi:hypothetical protein